MWDGSFWELSRSRGILGAAGGARPLARNVRHAGQSPRFRPEILGPRANQSAATRHCGTSWDISFLDRDWPSLRRVGQSQLARFVERIFSSWADLGRSGQTPAVTGRNSQFDDKQFFKERRASSPSSIYRPRCGFERRGAQRVLGEPHWRGRIGEISFWRGDFSCGALPKD